MRKLIVPLFALLFGASWADAQITSGDWTYDLNGNEATIEVYSPIAFAVKIPATIDGYRVTGIGDFVFSDRTGMTSVVIPDSVTSIGWQAFRNCTSLTSVTMPAALTRIGSYAFQGCTGLTSVTLPSSVTSIGVGAFQGCSSLTNLTLVPGGVVLDVGDEAFQFCQLAGTIKVPLLATIGAKAFPPGVSVEKDASGLVKAVADEILAALPQNYGIATKADLIKLPQTIVFTAPKNAMVGREFSLRASTKSGLPVSVTSSRPDIILVNGLTAKPIAPGTAELTATQPGNGAYAQAAPVKRTIVVR